MPTKSSIARTDRRAAGRDLPPTHPGEMLLEEFLADGRRSTRSPRRSAPPRRINEIVHGLRGISGDTALRLAGTSIEPEF
jgi:plasmid maintenance system antidote protein VapI